MPIYYNTSAPSQTTKNSINSVMSTLPNIRDFLLTLNLKPTQMLPAGYSTNTAINGSPKIGEPVLNTMVGTGNVLLPIGLPLETEGVLWKEQNTLTNTFKNDSSEANNLIGINYVLDIPYVSKTDNTSFGDAEWPRGLQRYPEGANDSIKKYGIYSKTVNAGFRTRNVIKNLYLDTTKQIDVSEFVNQDVPSINKQVNGYLDEYGGLNLGNSGAVKAANIIGSITSGQGLGLSKGGVVPNFDVRASLAGRVLGATGLINDTKLGKIGGQQLALALANNAAFNLQQDILGSLNIQDNVLSLVKGQGFAAFPRPNYNITVPKGNLGRAADYTSKLLGFTIPRSYVTDDGSIFQSESGEVNNIDRANALLLTTGKGQIQALLANVNASLKGTSSDGIKDNPRIDRISPFRSGYAPAYKNNKGNDEITDGLLYAFSLKPGQLTTDLFCMYDSKGVGDPTIPVLNYDKEEILREEFKGPEDIGFVGYQGNVTYDERKITDINFSWGTEKGGLVNSNSSGFEYSDLKGNKKSLLVKTQKLFNSFGMKNIVTNKGDMNKNSSQLTQANGKGFSKGNAVMTKNMFDLNTGLWKGESNKTAEETYCRSWTTLSRYDSVAGGYNQDRSGLVRNDALYSVDSGKVPFRFDTQNSVLEDTGFVKVVPYRKDFNNPNIDNGAITRNARNYMLSIENLAWADSYTMLPKGERGLGDPITGKRGRIMWFPPYDIQISESTSVDWESNKFIGRGENIYTYNNAERTGQLSFKIIVDHSTYTNTFRGDLGPDDHYVASFMAGCIEPDSIWTNKFTVQQSSRFVSNDENVPQKKVEPPKQIPPDNMNVYFPNDNSNFDGDFGGYENGKSGSTDIDYTVYKNVGAGIGKYRGKYTSRSYWPDSNNFGLNYNGIAYAKGDLKPSKVGTKEFKGFFSPGYYQALVDYFKTECTYCNVEVVGYASDQGENTPNAKLAKDRATYINNLLIENVAKPLGLTDDAIKKRFKANLKKSEELQTGEPVEITYIYEGKEKKVNVKLSKNGCKVCPKKEKNEPGGIPKKERYVACPVDTMGCKMDRFATITFTYDSDAASKDAVQPKDCIVTTRNEVTTEIREKFYNETLFFDKLEKTDRFIFDRFRERIKYFHPAFHSTTPEGLNSRLTFLQQCTRQGPTDNLSTNNLAFGRAPVCILRVGDFFYTKIIIDSLSIDYEPLVWDLNPEGIGVQPMIANVSLSFKFIGGESLYGPINKLQNAITFNYYANTRVYEGRADYISSEKPPEPKNNDTIDVAWVGSLEVASTDVDIVASRTDLYFNSGSKTANPEIKEYSKELSKITTCDENQVDSNEKVISKEPATDNDTNAEPKILGFEYVEVVNETAYDETNIIVIADILKHISVRLKTENIVNLKDDGTYERLIDDKKLGEFVTKGIKLTLDLTPTPDNTSRFEEIVNECDLEGWGTCGPVTNGKATWGLFESVYGLGDECSYCNNNVAVNLKINGYYSLTVYYNNEKIQSIPITISNDNFRYPNNLEGVA